MDEMPSLPPEQPIQQPPQYYQSSPTLSSLLSSKKALIGGLALLVLLILGGGIALLGASSTPKKNIAPTPAVYIPPTITPTPLIYPTSYPDETSTPTPPLSTITPISTTFKTYQGNFVTFKYPAAWSPKEGYLGGGTTYENVILGIPNVQSDQTMSFSDISVSDAKPQDVIKESSIVMGGKKGFKWIRKGSNYVSYDYITPGYLNKGSFMIHVTLSREDTQIETLLDTLSQSVSFK